MQSYTYFIQNTIQVHLINKVLLLVRRINLGLICEKAMHVLGKENVQKEVFYGMIRELISNSRN